MSLAVGEYAWSHTGQKHPDWNDRWQGRQRPTRPWKLKPTPPTSAWPHLEQPGPQLPAPPPVGPAPRPAPASGPGPGPASGPGPGLGPGRSGAPSRLDEGPELHAPRGSHSRASSSASANCAGRSPFFSFCPRKRPTCSSYGSTAPRPTHP